MSALEEPIRTLITQATTAHQSPWPYLRPYGSLTFEFRLTVAAGQSAGGYTLEPRAGGLATDYFIWAQQGYSSPQCGFRIGSSGGHSGGSGASGSNFGNGTASHTASVHTTPSRSPSPTPSPSAAASTSADPSTPPSPAAVSTRPYQHPQLTTVADAHTADATMTATSVALAASAAATLVCTALAGARFAGRRRARDRR